MKRLSRLFILLFTVVGLASCSKEIKFNGDESESKLVIYSVARAGEPLQVEVSHSAFFLKSGPIENYIGALKPDEGSVKLFVNGSMVPYVLVRREPQPDITDLPDAPLFYESTYVPAEGDRLRLVISFPGFDEASAETQVPYCTELTVNSVTPRAVNDEYTGLYHYYDLTLTINRGSDPSCYYGIRPYLHFEYTYAEFTASEYYSWNLESDDFLFQGNGSMTDQLSQLLSNDDVSMLFANTKIPSSSYTFRGSFMGYDIDLMRAEGATANYFLVFTTMNRDLYYYRTSHATASNSSSFSIFSEATSIYSNVKGGYGCFCAASSKKIALGL
ncbi:MAG: DUF4249 domain-containing protein [Bacteroidales bacterium]|nr:DUF4249 domain-containing protein [Bacteroidales bacterium]